MKLLLSLKSSPRVLISLTNNEITRNNVIIQWKNCFSSQRWTAERWRMSAYLCNHEAVVCLCAPPQQLFGIVTWSDTERRKEERANNNFELLFCISIYQFLRKVCIVWKAFCINKKFKKIVDKTRYTKYIKIYLRHLTVIYLKKKYK